jgi:NAD(P)-dependent dehydrogenase (short-subunit alcohol dehydrogenase family)
VAQRVALITGAGSGIGRATAEVLATTGYRLGLVDIDADRMSNVADTFGDDALVTVADVADARSVFAAAAATRDRFGSIDVLVCSAGHSEFIDFVDLTEATWRRMLDVHLTGAFNCSKAVVPTMQEQGFGRLVFISTSGVMNGGSGRLAHYIAAKAGLVGLARALARELGPYGITANCVAPGPIATPLLERVAPERFDGYLAATPVGRLGRPEDVAHAVRYLASEEAGFVTGWVLGVNGGRTMS